MQIPVFLMQNLQTLHWLLMLTYHLKNTPGPSNIHYKHAAIMRIMTKYGIGTQMLAL